MLVNYQGLIQRHYFSFIETSCVQLKLEVLAHSSVGQDQIDRAIKLAVDLDNPTTPIETNKYIAAFLNKLLLQREKLDRGLCVDHLKPGVVKLWQNIISILEDCNRKLLGVKNGSLIFTLFSPTHASMQQLDDRLWLNSLTSQLEKLLEAIGLF